MPTPVMMPQMGESIAEGTIVRWMKKVGDRVDRDEPLFEISTDKVDAEIPSPAAGTLIDIAVKEGDTVPVNSVVGTIGAEGEAAAAPARAAEPPQDARKAPAAPAAPAEYDAPDTQGDASGAPDESGVRSSPLVRRIAKEHHVDLGRISGTGIGGRVTKKDILGYLEGAESAAPAAPAPATRPAGVAPAGAEIVPMSVMRRKIAEHMVLSRRTSAHVYSVFEVNYTRVEELRRSRRDEYERRGVKLTYTAFIAKVVVDTLRRHRVVNASIDGDNIVYRGEVNLGIAVALEQGLIVPVVKQADEMNLLGLARAIADVAERARSKKLSPEEVHGGTFTITNPGNFGAQFGLPIINQPQVAILGVGTIEKRAVVMDDAIGIRLMGYLTLGYDHRLVDGAVADQFMADVKAGLESFEAERV
ncbi:MAG: dihydrolipoamide acetyltransferase family protein [Acidobacteriota bacterium]